MAVIDLIVPYDDEYMFYDWDNHRYVLTPKAIIDNVGEDLSIILNKGRSVNTQMLPQMFLDEISDFVYNDIYAHSNQNDIQEFYLAKLQTTRKIIFRAMLEQAKYTLVNGLLQQYAGVDLKKNTKSPDFTDRLLSPRARQILSREIPELGVPITWQGHYALIFKVDYETNKY